MNKYRVGIPDAAGQVCMGMLHQNDAEGPTHSDYPLQMKGLLQAKPEFSLLAKPQLCY